MPLVSRLAPRTRSDLPGHAVRVLVVDDDPWVVDSLRLVLSDEFEVETTTSALRALEWLTSGRWYDVILCDVMMSELDGVELRNRVHSARPEVAARIVFVTGGIVLPHVRDLLDGVPNTVLEKPLDLGALRELIRRRACGALPAGYHIEP
jgi:CheY-like chemotaxis protein